MARQKRISFGGAFKATARLGKGVLRKTFTNANITDSFPSMKKKPKHITKRKLHLKRRR